jgi:hypothetical protein
MEKKKMEKEQEEPISKFGFIGYWACWFEWDREALKKIIK